MTPSRIVGAVGDAFMQDLKQYLENFDPSQV